MEDKFIILPCFEYSTTDERLRENAAMILQTYVNQFNAPIPTGLRIEPNNGFDTAESYIVFGVIYGQYDGLPAMYVELKENKN